MELVNVMDKLQGVYDIVACYTKRKEQGRRRRLLGNEVLILVMLRKSEEDTLHNSRTRTIVYNLDYHK